VKGTIIHFIVDSGSHKNLISVEVIKSLALLTTPHPQPYTIGWLHQGIDLHFGQLSRLSYGIKPFKDEVVFDVSQSLDLRRSSIRSKNYSKRGTFDLTYHLPIVLVENKDET
jgi:hypothetical protein